MGATFEWDTVRKSPSTEAMGDILQRNRLVERLSTLPVMADCVVLLFSWLSFHSDAMFVLCRRLIVWRCRCNNVNRTPPVLKTRL